MRVLRRKKQTGESGTTDINLAPLIDISLVLVVILLLATPLAFESSIALQRAEASGRQAPRPAEALRVEMTILSDDTLRINRIVVRKVSCAKILQPLLSKQPQPQVVISCAGGVSHGTFVDVLDAAKLSGARDIAVSGR
jgi:biopolymer transport protein ExbD